MRTSWDETYPRQDRLLCSVVCLTHGLRFTCPPVIKPLKMTLAAVVQHIQVLEAGGLVHTEKVGRVRTCAFRAKGFDLASSWINARKSLWESKLDRLGALPDEQS